MLLKLIAIAFVVATTGRVLFRRQWQGLGRWLQRFVDLTLVLIAVVLGTQWILIALGRGS